MKSGQFNARHLAARDIASTFVVPDDFAGIANSEQNTLLVGPRGSGKTTILKALTSAGLYYLHERSDLQEYLSNLSINYFPVYIPAETSWKGDAEAVRLAISNESDRNHILNGLFVDHSLYQVVRAMEETQRLSSLNSNMERSAWLFDITENQEQNFCRHLSELWRLPKIQTSFVGLKLALIARSNDFVTPVTTRSRKSLDLAMNLPSLNIIQMLKGVMDVVQPEGLELKWSFNFDEMEIAPKHVVSMLYENLRSWDQRAILKFSLFPFVDFYTMEEKLKSSEKGPVEGPDFEAFHLTNEFKRKPSEFTEALVTSECQKRNTSIYDFAKFLNSSRAIIPNSRKFDGLKTERNFEGIFQKTFSDKTDASFIRYVKKQGFNSASELASVTGVTERARYIRKIAPICEFRNYYLTEDRSSANLSRRGSIKGFGYYHGFEKIIALTESNPRAIKFYVNDLLDAYEAKANSAASQNQAIRRNVDRFRALIASQVVPVESESSILENSLSAVDRFGEALSAGVLSKEFHPQPSLSLKLHSLDKQLTRIIEVAINAGALIVDRSVQNSKLIFDLDGQRMRLSYGFAPFNLLPTITGSPATFSSLPPSKFSRSSQADLFHWDQS